MTTYEWLLIAHLVGVFLLVAGSGAATVLGVAQGRTQSPKVMATLARLSEISEWALIYPGFLLAIVFGSWLVDEAGFDYDAGWIVTAYVIWALAILVGLFFLSPATKRLKRRAEELVAEGVDGSEELKRQAASPLVGAVAMLENVAVLAFLYLMVAKPGA
ncbi:MAG: DUF2269 family protein [Gaiellaceae bacterium]